jgi:iron complex transport system permease protein
MGSATIAFNEILLAKSLSHYIFFELRLPRIILAFFTGMGLALAGMLFQIIFRNPLMTPYTLGVSSGAILGAGMSIHLGLSFTILGLGAISIFGFLGAAFTILILILLAAKLQSKGSQTLLLLGIALSLFYSAALMVLFYLSSFTQLSTIIAFTMGNLSTVGMSTLFYVALAALILALMIYITRIELSILSISAEHAALKGVNTKKITYILLLGSSLAVGLIVSITGSIGFIGLIVPHMMVRVYKKPTTHLIIPIAMFGGLFLIAADLLARSLSAQEIPIGIITSFIGAPFFIYLLFRKQC